ncbi:hypothetical protein WNY77_02835 [Paraglaciecola mesophila]|jgi:hypothetical protein|uniref:Uncharacterized protein n=2 Tax=Paraglaciecola mesophila TaxID=197222 RepID=K6Z138_9ALTE|nr:hypothetical protein [Paraglaciecola mesophila]GAC24127.1 hypothetical protein GMES_1831 [Paraglaciecola mesophila KMM 241]|tara:strand:- start:3354 stop:3494 length:141 start_codon:yes stop_codon:yes gene_type:complete
MAADFTGFSVLMTDVKGDEIKINIRQPRLQPSSQTKTPAKKRVFAF